MSLFLALVNSASAQDDEKIRDKMREYIQQRLKLNQDEAEKFTPIFIRYFREWRTTLRDNRDDKLRLQQRIAELRIRYRDEFRGVLGERRSNEIYQHQEIFIKELKTIRQERINARPLRRNRSFLE